MAKARKPTVAADDKSSGSDVQSESLRLDKWLWFARFFKTRSLASTVCNGQKVRVDGQTVSKASYSIKPGQVLTFPQGKQIRIIRIEALGSRRGPAQEAQALYTDLAPPAKGGSDDSSPDSKPEAALPRREHGSGRPTKKERRQTDSLKNRFD